MLNLNRATLSLEPVNRAINDAIERSVAATAEMPRPYLGASIVGHDCARRIQYEWWVRPTLAARIREIFNRGHYFEQRARQHLAAIGFKFAPPEVLSFTAVGGALRGHADGIIIHGPDLPNIYLIFPLLWECKAINAKGWRALDRDGLGKAYPQYAAQVALYQRFLGVDENPAIFTAVNADTCERLHLLIPYDADMTRATIMRAETVIAATRAGELLPRFTADQKNWRCRLCGHRERCWRP
jgi:hypothetical protein